MTQPRYKPYVTSSPFSIGLSAISPRAWIEPDNDLDFYLDEKDRLITENAGGVFYEQEGSERAQDECLALLKMHLLADHARLYRLEGNDIVFGKRRISLEEPRSALHVAGSLIQDDLVVLERKEDGWHLTAGYVAFPSSWSLREKAGLAMEGIHAHVPGFADGTRNATMINRIFDNLKPDLPAARMNWSIYPAGDLHWPPERGARLATMPFDVARAFIRVERQTLRRLPATGAIVFTIRIYSDPLAVLDKLEDGGVTSRALADRLLELSPEQLAYKGLSARRDLLVDHLRSGG